MAADGIEKLRRLGLAVIVLWLVAIVVSALVTPPDPLSQLTVLAPLLLLGFLVAYALVYRLGW
jgi:Sec-independent protein secretion pathway component TatC